MQPVGVYLHSFSLRHHFAHQRGFDVFAFIDVAREQGFDGVTICAHGPGFGHLGGTDSRHFAEVRDALVANELGVEIQTSDTLPQHLHLLLEVAAVLGADCLCTHPRRSGAARNNRDAITADLRTVSERAKITGVTVALQDHGGCSGAEMADIVRCVESDFVRALFDYGNSQVIGEDPLVALQAMLPIVGVAHVRDQLVVADGDALHVQGVAAGDGMLPLEELTVRLYDAGQRRFCVRNAWSHVAAIQQPRSGLPVTPCFNVHRDRELVDGARLDPASAVAGEWFALQRSWIWLDAVLEAITGGARRAHEDAQDRDKPALESANGVRTQ